jgi:hypothetical protein
MARRTSSGRALKMSGLFAGFIFVVLPNRTYEDA